MGHLHRVMPAASVGLGLLVSTTNTASAAPFVQTDLVSDIPGLATIVLCAGGGVPRDPAGGSSRASAAPAGIVSR
jgi:hypothetical protein